jgi:pyruvate,water dikinase
MYILTSPTQLTPQHTIGGKASSNYTIGGKASNLFKLVSWGFNVPKFVVIPQEVLQPEHPASLQEILQEILAEFPNIEFWAVRSSAVAEDSAEQSFAGQYESYLYVTKENLLEKIQAVWQSAEAERVKVYNSLTPSPSPKERGTKEKALSFGEGLGEAVKGGLAVIVQEMIEADSAGVGFGINPVSGNKREKVVSAVWGLGEGLVSGELDSDNFLVGEDKNIQSTIATKTNAVVFDTEAKSGTKTIALPTKKQNLPALNDEQLHEISDILDRLFELYGKPQDIEFAVKGGKIFLLQTRPITNLHKILDKSETYTLWDNSNIIESYPHVTTPLTFSFISKSYEGAYKLFAQYLGVSKKMLRENERVFSNTLGLINGRVYYNLKTWYYMLAMLPSYRLNAGYMEKMMGVKERFDVPKSFFISKSSAWWQVGKTVVLMLARFRGLPTKRKKFVNLVNETIAQYKTIDYKTKTAHELMSLYLDFEKTLLQEWKAPLLNDFFAMVYFGRLQKLCEKYKLNTTNPNIHNDLLCGSSDIISTQPIHRTIEIASFIAEKPHLKELFLKKDENEIWQILQLSISKDVDEVRKAEFEKGEGFDFLKTLKYIHSYIKDFGERCMGELKLETISYTQEPAQFIKILKSYVQNNITTDKTSGKIEEEIRAKAMQEVHKKLAGKFWLKWKFNSTLQKARELVSARENLRYERTRAFGIVREIFTQIGKNFYANGIIDHVRDIFYLSKEEIFDYIEGKAITQNLKSLVALRQAEFEHYRSLPAPAERFGTYGAVYNANDFFNTDKVQAIEGDLKGIGCCPGRVVGKVRVVMNPQEASSLDGDILVTHSTDPGWVVLFPSASAIIVERGSLLSHSAIVAREMGKPCIVGVTGLLKTLKTGDTIEMDGSTGEIKILS